MFSVFKGVQQMLYWLRCKVQCTCKLLEILYVILHAVAFVHPDTILHSKDWKNQFIKPFMNSG